MVRSSNHGKTDAISNSDVSCDYKKSWKDVLKTAKPAPVTSAQAQAPGGAWCGAPMAPDMSHGPDAAVALNSTGNVLECSEASGDNTRNGNQLNIGKSEDGSAGGPHAPLVQKQILPQQFSNLSPQGALGEGQQQQQGVAEEDVAALEEQVRQLTLHVGAAEFSPMGPGGAGCSGVPHAAHNTYHGLHFGHGNNQAVDGIIQAHNMPMLHAAMRGPMPNGAMPYELMQQCYVHMQRQRQMFGGPPVLMSTPNAEELAGGKGGGADTAGRAMQPRSMDDMHQAQQAACMDAMQQAAMLRATAANAHMHSIEGGGQGAGAGGGRGGGVPAYINFNAYTAIMPALFPNAPMYMGPGGAGLMANMQGAPAQFWGGNAGIHAPDMGMGGHNAGGHGASHHSHAVNAMSQHQQHAMPQTSRRGGSGGSGARHRLMQPRPPYMPHMPHMRAQCGGAYSAHEHVYNKNAALKRGHMGSSSSRSTDYCNYHNTHTHTSLHTHSTVDMHAHAHMQEQQALRSDSASHHHSRSLDADPDKRKTRSPQHHHQTHHTHAKSANTAGETDKATPRTASENSEVFSVNVSSVELGEDDRTTLMVKNIPNKYTQRNLLELIDGSYAGAYDFFYLPIDFKNKCNLGYAFINFRDASSIGRFCREFDKQRWERFNSDKISVVTYARIQGKQALVSHFRSSRLMLKHEKYRPLIFNDKGRPENIPMTRAQTAAECAATAVAASGAVSASPENAAAIPLQQGQHAQEVQQQRADAPSAVEISTAAESGNAATPATAPATPATQIPQNGDVPQVQPEAASEELSTSTSSSGPDGEEAAAEDGTEEREYAAGGGL